MPNDLVSFVMDKAIEKFGGRRDGTFNGACFANALRETSGVEQTLDGKMVAAILVGREDVDRLSGGSHYRRR